MHEIRYANDHQQSAISNQQSAISNQQSAIFSIIQYVKQITAVLNQFQKAYLNILHYFKL